MKIRFAGYEICAGGEESPADLSISFSKQVDEFLPLRGKFATFKDRKGRATRATFTIEREHDSIGDAEKFTIFHDEEIPQGVGQAQFVSEDPGKFVVFPEAVCRVVSNQYFGVSTVTSYEIKGGAKQITSIGV